MFCLIYTRVFKKTKVQSKVIKISVLLNQSWYFYSVEMKFFRSLTLPEKTLLTKSYFLISTNCTVIKCTGRGRSVRNWVILQLFRAAPSNPPTPNLLLLQRCNIPTCFQRRCYFRKELGDDGRDIVLNQDLELRGKGDDWEYRQRSITQLSLR